MLMLLLATILVGLAAHQALAAVSVRQSQLAASLRRAGRYGGFTLRQGELTRGASERIIGPSAQRLAELALRLTPKASVHDVRNKLQAAGLGDVTPTSFLAVKGALAGIVLVVGLLTLVTGAKPPLIALGIALGGGYASLVLPDAYLGMRTRGRKEELTAQMPDVLDLLTVSVEAGLGFDAALVKVGERMEGPLIEELQLVIHEMRIGESRAKALKNFAERLDVPETTAFARSIIQADQLGIALGRILRVQAQDMRNRRQMAAEEKAMKAPVKMLVPTAIFIFPAMFVVILGPAMLSLVRMFAEL